MQRTTWKNGGIVFLSASLIPLCIGFHKMFFYENSEYSFVDPVNVYVGGDAYNYIINANYATGYFVLATLLVVAAIGCGVMYYLSNINEIMASDKSGNHSEVDNENQSEDI